MSVGLNTHLIADRRREAEDLIRGPITVRNKNKPFVVDPLKIVCTYLPTSDLRSMDLVNRFFKEASESGWQARAQENHCPEIPLDFPYKRFVCQIVPRMFGKAFHETYIGELPDGVPSIPVNHITVAFHPDPFDPTQQVFQTHVWVYVPPQLKVRHSNKEISLKMEKPIGYSVYPDYSGHLMESLSGAEEIVVQTTLNNMGFIVANCLKKGHPTGFDKRRVPDVFAQHGMTRISGGWYLLRRAVVETKTFYAVQESAVEGKKLEATPLFVRVCAEFYQFIQSKNFLDLQNRVVRTEPVTFIRGRHPYFCQVNLQWVNNGSFPLLRLFSNTALFGALTTTAVSVCGGGVGVPAASSEATST